MIMVTGDLKNDVCNKQGENIDREASCDRSCYSVVISVDGCFLAIGAPDNDKNKCNLGHVRLFEFSAHSNRIRSNQRRK